jgi:hypothetical protein
VLFAYLQTKNVHSGKEYPLQPIKLLCCWAYAVGLYAFVTSPALGEQAPDNAKINDLLAQARTEARLAFEDAAALHAYTSSLVSWQSNATRRNFMKARVNDLWKTYKDLIDSQEQYSPWQRDAIDRIAPLLKSLAHHLDTKINHRNENTGRANMPSFRDYAEADNALAYKTAQTIDDRVACSKTKAKTEAFKWKLDLLPSSESNE